jgi:hypothetical protein
MKRKYTKRIRKESKGVEKDAVSQPEIAIHNPKTGLTVYVFTPLSKMTPEKKKQMEELYINRYQKPSIEEVNKYPEV